MKRKEIDSGKRRQDSKLKLHRQISNVNPHTEIMELSEKRVKEMSEEEIKKISPFLIPGLKRK